ncbi:DNA polymerase III subunit delta [Dokdonia sp. Hel_I_53]|uniref:DNA polymerase III subunit delta n=1 Tax=Dokdonia sp. Hel_I_53 TaxID=1566287 RepID=UPI00119AD2E7|nr:DNA polymerase III subunit delta [Dokdonia sp. Hel_I_53]TVZ51092.1 DNA polymerase III delta subunit [Dokdonia sp. Hel_I_53]
MEHAKNIVADIKKGVIKPIYFLSGEEPYFIDQITNYIEQNVLSESEKGFNQMVLYGRDVTIDDIVSNAKRYPMMAERQVIIVKEAQDLSRTIEKLVTYVENPQPTTVLVLAYKYKKLDKRKGLAKSLKKHGILYENKKLYENKVGDWIRNVLIDQGYHIQPKAAQMLVDYLGNDLSKVVNELNKLMLILPKGSDITPQSIEENIGISKDFNIFELRKAIGEKDIVKAQRIAQYFSQNPKDNPLVLTVGQVFSLFSNVMKYHGLPQKDKATVAKVLGISPFFVGEYVTAARNYPMKKVSACIAMIREVDVKSKGVGASAFASNDLLKELLVKIMN